MADPIYYDRTGKTVIDDPKQAALDMLLAEAQTRGDQGASTGTVNQLLNEVDMGAAGRASDAQAANLSAVRGSGDSMLAATGAALEQLRQEALAERARAGSGGRGGGGGSKPFTMPDFNPRRDSLAMMGFKNNAIANLVYGFDTHHLPKQANQNAGFDDSGLDQRQPSGGGWWRPGAAPQKDIWGRPIVAQPAGPPRAKVVRGEAPRPARGGAY